jgi:hypothetical protein
VEYFNYLLSTIKIKHNVHVKLNPRLPWQNQHPTGRRLFNSKLDLNLRKTLVKCYIWGIALYGAGTWTLRKVYHKHVEIF